MTIKIAVLGYGRMGKALEQCINEADDLELSGVWVRGKTDELNDLKSIYSTELSKALASAQVAIDFTLPEATEQIVRAANRRGIPLVCGVSGLPAATIQLFVAASSGIPIMYDRNMSLGIAVLQQAVQLVGSILTDDYDVEIHETHHIHKIDAPSGTALQLGESLAECRKQSFKNIYHYDPCGTSKPAPGQIDFKVSRRGDVPGEHTVSFKGVNECLSLMHKVDDRSVFVEGAISAARWLIHQPSRLYNMQDLVRDPFY